MDDYKKMMKGAPSRDIFKQKHKELNNKYWACDMDFILVEKNPNRIIACLDFKTPKDKITFSEVLAYNDLLQKGVKIFIVSGDAENGIFKIKEYKGGNPGPEPPEVNLNLLCKTNSWDDFERWEGGLRGVPSIEPIPIERRKNVGIMQTLVSKWF